MEETSFVGRDVSGSYSQDCDQSELNSHKEGSKRSMDTTVMGFKCPINVLEKIFSFLGPKDLCICAKVSWYWNIVSSQNFIWEYHLKKDKKSWKRITNKKMQNDAKVEKESADNNEQSTERSYKQEYLLFKPDNQTTNGIISSVYRMFQSATRKYKFAFFGSGLEVPGSKRIARYILTPPVGSLFTSNGFYPGHKGVGSGVCVRMADKYNLIICFFYSNIRSVREQRSDKQPYSSALFQEEPTTESEQNTCNQDTCTSSTTVKSNLREALQSMDGLVYVVNSDVAMNCYDLDKVDFHLLQSVCGDSVPLVVFSTISSSDKERVSCADMIDILQLQSLKRPWMVTDVVESSFSGVEEGLTWLAQNC